MALSTAIDLMASHKDMDRRQRDDLEELTEGIREGLSSYATGEPLRLIREWIRDSASWATLRVLNEALRDGTMPYSPDELAKAIKTSGERSVVEYVRVGHLLRGQSYTSEHVIASLNGMRDSSLTQHLDIINNDDDATEAAVMIEFMRGANGTSVVSSGYFGVVAKNILLSEDIGRMVLDNPDRVSDIIRFIKERPNQALDDEAREVAEREETDIAAIMEVIDRKNKAYAEVVREMLESDHGVFVDGML